VFHTYSAHTRGIDLLNTAYNYLDLVPKALTRRDRDPSSGFVATTSTTSPSQGSTIGRVDDFVPRDFDVPRRLERPQFVLEPLGPEHNDQDYDAWASSREHIHATPGWEDSSWPREMTPDENRADLQRHADDFRNRTGFTYTVLDPASRDVIGCVYIYPLPDSDYDARALSWVRASHAQLDTPLWRVVSEWLASDWPFGSVEYAPRT
jgi:RimJ/RimL family protein N-acetyltransferase